MKHQNIKKYVYEILKLAIFLMILFLCINIVDNITKRKDPYQKNKDFFSQESDFDVLFFGSSHSLNSIFPMCLWNDYGIISYNLSNHGERIAASYYNMRLATNETKPKLVVIDAFMANYYREN